MSREKKALPIPKAVIDQIQAALEAETCVITKAGIMLQMQTGLRISEVLSIREGCVVKNDGKYFLQVTVSKTVKGEPVIHKVGISENCRKMIADLALATEPLRQESGRKELFLVRNHGIHVASARKWSNVRLKNFVKKHNITDADGKLYPLHSHQFRATFVHDRILDGHGVLLVQKQLRHVTPEMTRHYLTLDEQELETFFEKGIQCFT